MQMKHSETFDKIICPENIKPESSLKTAKLIWKKSSHSCHFVKEFLICTKFRHAYVSYVYIVYVKYCINSSKV